MLVTVNQQECENLSLAKMFSGSDVTSYAIRSHTVRYDTRCLQDPQSKILATPMVTNAQEAQQKKEKNTASMQADKNASAEKMSC